MVAFIQRVSITMPDPTVIDGRPQQPWQPSAVVREDWGKLQLIIAGRGFTRFRNKRWIPLTDRHTEPFGDADAAFILPGMTEWDDPATYHITKLAPVHWRRKDPDGVFHVIYEGHIADFEPDTGEGLTVQCIGSLFRADLLKEPPALFSEPEDGGRLIVRAFNHKQRNYALDIGHMHHQATGVQIQPNQDFAPFLTGAIQDYLSQMNVNDDSTQWTVSLHRPRTPVLEEKDTTTVTATVSYGTPGVDCSLSKDFTTATTGVYGTGTNGHCQWMGARFPNLVETDTPAFPLGVGETFVAGDGQAGFADFAAYLRRGQYGTIVSDDTYDPADVDNVEQFQDRAGITVDGIVGAQTWEAAFEPGANQGSVRGAWVGPIWERSEVRKRLRNAQGADTGPNPAFDPRVPAIEDFVPFGNHVSKNLARESAKQIVHRAYPAGRRGTITLTVDPEETSRFGLHAGDNILVRNYNGEDLLLHVIDRTRDWRALSVTLTVDEHALDLPTAAAIHQRQREIADLTRTQRFGRTRSKVFNDYGAWLCEDGAGEIPLMNQQAGFWNVQRIAAAPKGGIDRITLAMGSGLTEHLLNVALGDSKDSADPIPGAARGAVAIFAKPVKANTLAHSLGNPVQLDTNGDNPWDREADKLRRRGLIFAAGGPGAQIGFYPFEDPGDGTDTHLSGLFNDGGGVQYGPTGHYWLWVCIWTSTSCKVGGRLFPAPPS